MSARSSVSAAPTRMVLERGHVLDADLGGELGDQGHVVEEARPARALSSVAGSSPRVRARWTRYAPAFQATAQ